MTCRGYGRAFSDAGELGARSASISRPLLTGDPVYDVAAEAVVVKEAGVIEVQVGRSDHSQSLHDSLRPLVGWDGPAQDLLQLRLFESEVEDRLGCLGGITTPPLVLGESPANLDCRREMGLEGRHGETAEADEFLGPFDVHCPEPKAEFLELAVDSSEHLIRFFGRKHVRKVLHDLGVGIERSELITVSFPPAPEDEALGFDGWPARHAGEGRPKCFEASQDQGGSGPGGMKRIRPGPSRSSMR